MLDHNMIELLRVTIAEQAQSVYDSYIKRSPERGGGICDEIVEEIIGLLYDNLEGVDVRSRGGDGDDHAPVVAVIQGTTYLINIPRYIYEEIKGDTWEVIPGVKFVGSDVIFEET